MTHPFSGAQPDPRLSLYRAHGAHRDFGVPADHRPAAVGMGHPGMVRTFGCHEPGFCQSLDDVPALYIDVIWSATRLSIENMDDRRWRTQMPELYESYFAPSERGENEPP